MIESQHNLDDTITHRCGARAAVVSVCSRYRYYLERRIRPGDRRVLFVMLNPSTADGLTDDPTIRRCVGFADRWGYDLLTVCNLFAYRSPHPKELKLAICPHGPLNLAYLAYEISVAETVVCAWGACPSAEVPAAQFVEWARRSWAAKLHHLGLTTGGQPKHPLARGRHRIPDDVVPQPLVSE